MIVIPFQLLLKPVSGKCNAHCSYCFYRAVPDLFPDKPLEPMADAILEETIKKYLALGFRENVFIWQGGEPTLAGLDFFERVVKYQTEFGKNQTVGNALQTNGYLIDEKWAQFLQKYRFLVGLSIDGPPHIHDAARGKGSYAKASAALKCMLDHQVPVNLLSVVYKDNAGKIGEIYEYLRQMPTTFLQFIPALDNDPKTEKPTSYSLSPKMYGDVLCRLFDAWKNRDAYRVSVRTFDFVINTLLGVPGNMCSLMPACSPYLVVENQGDVYPCDFFVRPDLRLGNVVTDSFEDLLAQRAKDFSTRKAKRDDSCAECPWLALCHGGCLKDRVFDKNPHKGKSYFCIAYKRFFKYSFHWFVNKAVEAGRQYRLRPRVLDLFDPQKPCPCKSGRSLTECLKANASS